MDQLTTIVGGRRPTPGIALTAQEAMIWIKKPGYSSDGKNIGQVAVFARDG